MVFFLVRLFPIISMSHGKNDVDLDACVSFKALRLLTVAGFD
uniref:Uncharacterized protein n=1 Tax=Rhizophora mucronata TaxID=61149 RepID=A0A2P2QIK7_RHIMU